MKIRVMNIEDYEGVHALWMSCEGMGLNNLDESREGVAKFLRRNPASCFVAEEDEKIIGTVWAGHDGHRGWLYHVAVAPSHRGRGIGSSLVARALEALKEEGITKAALLVFSRNAPGNAFWEKEGFTARPDVIYRNKALVEVIRIDT